MSEEGPASTPQALTALQAHALLAGSRVARLATVGADGAPHLVPIVFAVLEGEVVSAVDHKPKRTRELRRLENVAANPRVSVIADHYDEDWAKLWWVRADGVARVLEAGSDAERHAIDALVLKYHQYDERRPAGPILAIAVARLTAWSAAGGA